MNCASATCSTARWLTVGWLERACAGLEMRRRGWTAEQIDGVIYQNPIRFMGQSEKFKAPVA